MVNICLLLLLMSSMIWAADGAKVKPTVTIPAEFQNALSDSQQAVEVIGDALIKSGLLSPWLNDMRETQKALNDLERSKKFGIKDYAMQQMIKDTDRCKELQKTRNTPNALKSKLDKFGEQKKALIKKIIQDNSTDVSGVIVLNKQIDEAVNADYASIRSKKGQSSPVQDSKPKGSAEYDALIDKLQALHEILTRASSSGTMGELKQPIKDLLGSKQLKPYQDILERAGVGEGCTPEIATYRHYADDVYGQFINMLFALLS